MSLHEKMARIMAEVPAIQNDKRIEGSKASYNVATIQAVLKIIRPLLVREKVLFFPIESVSTVTNNIAKIDAKYKIVDVETGESETIGGSGAGFDNSDKHVGKASTYAFKTALLKTFCLATTDEDPDVFSSDDNVNQAKMAEQARREKVISGIKTNEQLADYIKSLAERGKINPAESYSLVSKAMSITTDAERNSAVSWLLDFDK